ncbi:hypothetical protein [Mesoplasma seiffertii]|uniref:hypothetical protein n=1 Tax=Mesoplasma seiffertii TaxID=28224 RepID=UPI000479EB5F|nr:hypothetical protein [Mesoplasma seiffertii]
MKKLLSLCSAVGLTISLVPLTVSCFWNVNTRPPYVSSDQFEKDEWYTTPLSEGIIKVTDSIENKTFANEDELKVTANAALAEYINSKELIFGEDIFYKVIYKDKNQPWDSTIFTHEEIGEAKEIYAYSIIEDKHIEGSHNIVSEKLKRGIIGEEIVAAPMFKARKEMYDIKITINE